MKVFFKKSVLALLLFGSGKLAQAEPGVMTIEVQTAPGKNSTNYPTRTLAALPVSETNRVDSNLDQYGGWLDRKAKATGFFYPAMIGGRWWLVDPQGGLFLHKGIVAVSPMRGPLAGTAFEEKFGNNSN